MGSWRHIGYVALSSHFVSLLFRILGSCEASRTFHKVYPISFFLDISILNNHLCILLFHNVGTYVANGVHFVESSRSSQLPRILNRSETKKKIESSVLLLYWYIFISWPSLPRILNRSETKKKLRVLFCYFIGTSSFLGHHVVFLRVPSPVCGTTKCCCFSSFGSCVSGIYEAFLFAKFFNQEHCDFLTCKQWKILLLCLFASALQLGTILWICLSSMFSWSRWS